MAGPGTRAEDRAATDAAVNSLLQLLPEMESATGKLRKQRSALTVISHDNSINNNNNNNAPAASTQQQQQSATATPHSETVTETAAETVTETAPASATETEAQQSGDDLSRWHAALASTGWSPAVLAWIDSLRIRNDRYRLTKAL